MSTSRTNTGSTAAQTDDPVAEETTFTLTATNESSVPGAQYFNVFPPKLISPAQGTVIYTALVSNQTTKANPTVTMSWKGGAGALAMTALTKTMKIGNAAQTPVALGETVAVDWIDEAFTLTPTAGGPEGVITVTFSQNIPADSYVGLVVGPAPVLVPIQGNGSPLTLEPDLTPVVTVAFGTAFQWPKPQVWDESNAKTVTFKQGDTNGVYAQIQVGADNLIVETS
jgi:hypothetical protein